MQDSALVDGLKPVKMPVDEAEQILALQLALKCADIGAQAETLEVRGNVGVWRHGDACRGDDVKRGQAGWDVWVKQVTLTCLRRCEPSVNRGAGCIVQLWVHMLSVV